MSPQPTTPNPPSHTHTHTYKHTQIDAHTRTAKTKHPRPKAMEAIMSSITPGGKARSSNRANTHTHILTQMHAHIHTHTEASQTNNPYIYIRAAVFGQFDPPQQKYIYICIYETLSLTKNVRRYSPLAAVATELWELHSDQTQTHEHNNAAAKCFLTKDLPNSTIPQASPKRSKPNH
jgi:hypothetical protein